MMNNKEQEKKPLTTEKKLPAEKKEKGRIRLEEKDLVQSGGRHA